MHRAAINQYRLAMGPTAANPPHAAAAGKWDRQTDGQTDGHRRRTVTQILPHTICAVPIITAESNKQPKYGHAVD